MASIEVRCSLLLRILKVYRTEIHSGYIQYTYRGFHNPRRDAGLVITLQGHVLTFQEPVYRRIRCFEDDELRAVDVRRSFADDRS